MDFLFAGGVGFFTGFFPGIAFWLLVTFGVPELLAKVKTYLPEKNQKRYDDIMGSFAVVWVAVLLFGPPLVLLCLFLFWGK